MFVFESIRRMIQWCLLRCGLHVGQWIFCLASCCSKVLLHCENPNLLNALFYRLMWMGKQRLLCINSWRTAKEEECQGIILNGTLPSFLWTSRGRLWNAMNRQLLPLHLRWNPCVSILSTCCFWFIVSAHWYALWGMFWKLIMCFCLPSVNVTSVWDNPILQELCAQNHNERFMFPYYFVGHQ